MGLKAAIQALKKAEKLKEKVQNSKDLLNDNDAWVCQQQLQRIYQQVLILDLEYALDKKVEQELWNHGFKNYIATLQNLAKDKKNPKRTESQAMLSWCLEAASGFYLMLLQELCTAFDVDLPFRRKGELYGNGKLWKSVEHLSQPHKSSCYYICQHCLVHLGDIARYRSQSRQAEAFYRHAVQLAPSSGQPYNQLALLEASRGDRLSTVFHYVRSVAVRHLFPAAATNLARTFNKSLEEELNVEGRIRLSVSEYVAAFLKLHALLHSSSKLVEAECCVKVLTTTLTAHVATESLTSWKLVQMLAINLFALYNAGRGLDLDPDKPVPSLSDNQLTNEERCARRLVLDLMAGSLSAFLLPVYTLKDEDLLGYFALPAIKLTLEWIHLEPRVLLDAAFASRLQIWPSLCKLLNGLQLALADFVSDKYSYVALPEDRDLQGFLPLERAFTDLRFSIQDWKMDTSTFNKLRANRLLEFGVWLANHDTHRLITRRYHMFETVGGQQIPPSELIRELEELSLTKLPSPAPSEASSWGSSVTGSSTPDIVPAVVPHSPPLERRAGILKPQGSLEKAREKEGSNDGSWNGLMVMRRGRQNVAMQAIMRKSSVQRDQETVRSLESKQVTFKTPSPRNSPSSSHGADESPVAKLTWQQPKHPAKTHLQNFAYQVAQLNCSPTQSPVQIPNRQPKPQQQTLFNTRTELHTAQPQTAYKSFIGQVPPPTATSSFHQQNTGNNLPLYQQQQQQQQQQQFGMKLHQSSFSPWQEDAPPLPPASWWQGPAGGNSSPFAPVGFSNGLVTQSPAEEQWGSQHLSVNLHHQLVGSHRGHPLFSANTQPTYQGRTMFTANGNQESEVLLEPNSKAELPVGASVDSSTIFSSSSSTGGTSSPFGGLGGNTYSLFSTAGWAGANPSCNLETEGNNVRDGLDGVMGVTLGQQSLWSGPGPSPLERLLEQQKQLREGPAPKGGT